MATCRYSLMPDCLAGRAAGDHLPRNFAAPKVYTERRCAAIPGIHVMKSGIGWVMGCQALEFSLDRPQVMMICWKNTDDHAFTTTGKLRKLNPMHT
jgi:hypothetical protein